MDLLVYVLSPYMFAKSCIAAKNGAHYLIILLWGAMAVGVVAFAVLMGQNHSEEGAVYRIVGAAILAVVGPVIARRYWR